jgi:hypothetical protein
MFSLSTNVSAAIGLLFLLGIVVMVKSIYSIGPTQVGLVRKRIGSRLPDDNPVAFNGEAGYQADLLMPGLRFKFYLFYAVTRHPWVQIPAGQIGVVNTQIGEALPIGAKSAVYTPQFGTFTDLCAFADGVERKEGNPRIKGQKGVQRPVLPPGTLVPIHPVAFLVIARQKVYGVPVSQELRQSMKGGQLTYQAWNPVSEDSLDVTRIEPRAAEGRHVIDMVGVVTPLEGDALPAGDIASRLGGFEDIKAIEA